MHPPEPFRSPLPTPPPPAVPAVPPEQPAGPPPTGSALPPPSIRRFAATDVTFGPRGRIIATAVLLLPYALFLYTFIGWGMAGLVLYTPVFWRGMRDVWRRADRVIDRRTASERGHGVTRPDDVPLVRTDWDDPPPARW